MARGTAELECIQLLDPSSTSGAPAPVRHDDGPVPPRRRAASLWRTVAVHVGWTALGAALAVLWVWREQLDDRFGPWWYAVPGLVIVAVLARPRPAPPKSASHPALQVRRGRHWTYRPVLRPLGRRSDVANVFVDADSVAAAAWPGADLDVARRWTIDASERVAVRFGTKVAVLVGPGGPALADRDGVRVVHVHPGGSIRDALWEVVAPVDPSLFMLFVTDDEQAAVVARAHGAQVMPCRNWMTLADR